MIRFGHDLQRSIPAQAGEPTSDALNIPAVTVYPRTGGGTSNV